MKIALIIAGLLAVMSPVNAFAKRPQPRYTTIILEYVGETDRLANRIVISTSEGEWYTQGLYGPPNRISVLVHAHIVSASTLHQLTQAFLMAQREQRRPERSKIKTPTLRLVAGLGSEYTEVTLWAVPSMKVMLDIHEHVGEYPELEADIRELENRVKDMVRIFYPNHHVVNEKTRSITEPSR